MTKELPVIPMKVTVLSQNVGTNMVLNCQVLHLGTSKAFQREKTVMGMKVITDYRCGCSLFLDRDVTDCWVPPISLDDRS